MLAKTLKALASPHPKRRRHGQAAFERGMPNGRFVELQTERKIRDWPSPLPRPTSSPAPKNDAPSGDPGVNYIPATEISTPNFRQRLVRIGAAVPADRGHGRHTKNSTYSEMFYKKFPATFHVMVSCRAKHVGVAKLASARAGSCLLPRRSPLFFFEPRVRRNSGRRPSRWRLSTGWFHWA